MQEVLSKAALRNFCWASDFTGGFLSTGYDSNCAIGLRLLRNVAQQQS